ncbi:glycosyl transferase [Salinimicrobium marinum]|uniref:Glycosyl transferase n=1 Tax=Salinimicrobium marinum TaxID=680283 RepID=A0A918VYM7_9FLAO|nr:glycosyltransferase family protein [Salinimicrobium marinum]GHA37932.1 glycosyl transferase [Salinimicrobium marinum]
MKILYAVQGTGNGHLSRARDVIPLLKNIGEVDILVSGTQADMTLPYDVKYQMKGLGFIFGKRGGVDLWKTFIQNNIRGIIREIQKVPVHQYDVVINDFEPVSAWACYFKRRPCIALSHQCAVLAVNAPLPKHRDRIGRLILKYYAPSTVKYGFHFSSFNDQTYTPVIRRQVRELFVSNNGHYTVYLPSYSDKKLIKILSRFSDIKWEVFSKHNRKAYDCGNVFLKPVHNEAFLESMASSKGILCGAGFETPSEALFLKKKLLVVPMENQYEQHCNAAALKVLGVTVLKNLKKKQFPKIREWLNTESLIQVDFPDITEEIIQTLLNNHFITNLSAVNQSFLGSIDSPVN